MSSEVAISVNHLCSQARELLGNKALAAGNSADDAEDLHRVMIGFKTTNDAQTSAICGVGACVADDRFASDTIRRSSGFGESSREECAVESKRCRVA